MFRAFKEKWLENPIKRAERKVKEADEEMRRAAREEYVAKLAKHLENESNRRLYDQITSSHQMKYLDLNEAKLEMAVAQQKFLVAMRRLDDLKLGYVVPSKVSLEEAIVEFVASAKNNPEGSTSTIRETEIKVDKYIYNATNDLDVACVSSADVTYEYASIEDETLEEEEQVEEVGQSLIVPSKSPMEEMLAQFMESSQKIREESTADIKELKSQLGQALNYLDQRELDGTVGGTSIENEGLKEESLVTLERSPLMEVFAQYMESSKQICEENEALDRLLTSQKENRERSAIDISEHEVQNNSYAYSVY